MPANNLTCHYFGDRSFGHHCYATTSNKSAKR